MSTDLVNPMTTSIQQVRLVSWKAPIGYAVIAILSLLLFVGLASDGVATFVLTKDNAAIQLAPIDVGARAFGVIVAIALVVLTGVAFLLAARRRPVPIWLTLAFGLLFVVGFLAWATGAATQTNTLQVAGLLAGTFGVAVPLIYGSLSGVIGERVGVVNIAIEGQLLFGAFGAALVATMTGSPWAGLFAAAVAGVLVAFVLAAFSIRYFVDQIITGVVLNLLVVGVTSFFYSALMTGNPETYNDPRLAQFSKFPIPGLSEIPLLGPMFFEQTLIGYLAIVAVLVTWFALYRTKWGLRLRSVGEHPTAADTVGINVNRTRFWNVALGGAIAGIGGASYTIGTGVAFGENMTGGAGYIALAAVIFGQWDPLKAALAALLFGFTSNLGSQLSLIGSPVPSVFMLMLPYVVTILAVAGLVGRSRPPAADGVPYIKS